MTVIAWDGKTLAADRLVLYGSTKQRATKIRRAGKLIMGASGDSCQAESMMRWVAAGADPATFPHRQNSEKDFSNTLVIQPDGTPWIYSQTPDPCIYDKQKIAIGSGSDFALTAMHLGCTAEMAVIVTSELTSDCGAGVDTLELE